MCQAAARVAPSPHDALVAYLIFRLDDRAPIGGYGHGEKFFVQLEIVLVLDHGLGFPRGELIARALDRQIALGV